MLVRAYYPHGLNSPEAPHGDLALGEIIVYSGSILVIVVEVTGHRVAFQVAFTPPIASHRCVCLGQAQGERP